MRSFCEARSFREELGLVMGLPPGTRSRFLSCLSSNYRLLATYGKAVFLDSVEDFSVPVGREVRIGVLQAEGGVGLAEYRDGKFVGSTSVAPGKEFTTREGTYRLFPGRPTSLVITSGPSQGA